MRRPGSIPCSSGVGPSAPEPPGGGGRHHRRVVGAQLDAAAARPGGRRPRRPSSTPARSAELAATPPPMTTVPIPVARRGPQQLGHEHVDDRGLERRGDVGDLGLGMLAHVLHHRGLQPREREVVAVVEHRARERDRVRIALACQAVDRRTAGIAEPEEPRDLVERLARRVVDRLAEHAVLAVVVHRDEQRVPARHDERDATAARASGPRAAPRTCAPRDG